MNIISHTKFLDFKSAPSPNNSPWYYVKRTNDKQGSDSAVVICPIVKIDGDYNFLFLKTVRPPITAENKAKYCLEFPAGLIADIDKDEDILSCAKKELMEEAGLEADKIFLELQNCSTSSGLSSETIGFVTTIIEEAKIINKPVSDGGIIVDRFYVKTSEIYQFLSSLNNSEYSIATATISAIYLGLNRLNLSNLKY